MLPAEVGAGVFFRECQRAHVMPAHVGLADEIDPQVIRIERVAFGVALVALAGLAHARMDMGIGPIAMVVLLVIVLKRCPALCCEINRGHFAEKLRQAASEKDAEPPTSEVQ